mmetsp:Transcript_35383/g.95929  ORF Transcript_35383/g.95929 Transcript_35383/m.95929 type:complete len:247 (+) Transcript_35383:821-1561(+)
MRSPRAARRLSRPAARTLNWPWMREPRSGKKPSRPRPRTSRCPSKPRLRTSSSKCPSRPRLAARRGRRRCPRSRSARMSGRRMRRSPSPSGCASRRARKKGSQRRRRRSSRRTGRRRTSLGRIRQRFRWKFRFSLASRPSLARRWPALPQARAAQREPQLEPRLMRPLCSKWRPTSARRAVAWLLADWPLSSPVSKRCSSPLTLISSPRAAASSWSACGVFPLRRRSREARPRAPGRRRRAGRLSE